MRRVTDTTKFVSAAILALVGTCVMIVAEASAMKDKRRAETLGGGLIHFETKIRSAETGCIDADEDGRCADDEHVHKIRIKKPASVEAAEEDPPQNADFCNAATDGREYHWLLIKGGSKRLYEDAWLAGDRGYKVRIFIEPKPVDGYCIVADIKTHFD